MKMTIKQKNTVSLGSHSTEKLKLRTAVTATVLLTSISAAFLTASIVSENGKQHVGTAKQGLEQEMQTANVTLFYAKQDGSTGKFQFLFQEPREGEHPVKKYILGRNGQDEFSEKFEDKFGKAVEESYNYGSLAVNTTLRDKIMEHLPKGNLLREMGADELPNYLNGETNNLVTAPNQKNFWKIDVDGDGDMEALQLSFTQGAVHRSQEDVVHTVNLKNNTYCERAYLGDGFRRSYGISAGSVPKCQNLNEMEGVVRNQLFEKFNAQQMQYTYVSNANGATLSTKMDGTHSLARKRKTAPRI